MSVFIFLVTLATETLTTLVVVLSILVPQQRIWPPNEQKAWGKTLMLILFNLTAFGVILLGILDWNSYLISLWIRFAIGLPVWLAGNILAAWAVITLGLARTSGEADALIRRGPYRFSRNPQYLGFMLGLAGWAVLTNSALTLITALAALPPLALVPLAEEPWLQAQYGKEFEEYRREVPRFFSLDHIKADL
ncbi:MAG: isoprenylcysteine carboxylmethyltransferase family protein [Anaerolineales bacterium]|nr:isoprenylcysteine carboxylmethyltransferase family protein [Anaerolineales bacterium]